jgi:hypothetical protein
VLSEKALAPLITTAVRGGDLTAIRTLGSQLGSAAASIFGDRLGSASTVDLMEHAAGLTALYGWGRMQLEQWGHALVLEITGTPTLDDDNLAMAALLGGLFSTLSGNEVACVPLAESSKYIMVDPSIAEQVWSWSKSGDDLAAIVGKLKT